MARAHQFTRAVVDPLGGFQQENGQDNSCYKYKIMFKQARATEPSDSDHLYLCSLVEMDKKFLSAADECATAERTCKSGSVFMIHKGVVNYQVLAALGITSEDQDTLLTRAMVGCTTLHRIRAFH